MSLSRAFFVRAFLSLPDGLRERWMSRMQGYGADDVPAPTGAPRTPIRLLIGPANYAGQGWMWARAAERLTGVGAKNMEVRPAGLHFRADDVVPVAVAARSARWGRAQFAAVSSSFTHVIFESMRPMFGREFDGDVVAEIEALRGKGIRVASLAHGTDLRDPTRHREREALSPYAQAEFLRSAMPAYQRNRRAFDQIDGAAHVHYVSTPDLLRDFPEATWLPVVVDMDRWAVGATPARDRLRVLHAPSSAAAKGTSSILPVLRELASRGTIDLDLPAGVLPQEMPARVGSADVVVDQFALGSYGVAACEAMAAGRIVVAHVAPDVRARAEAAAGMPLPIVEATPETLGGVLAGFARERSSALADALVDGPEFVRRLHDGTAAAAAMAPFLSTRPAIAGGDMGESWTTPK